ncbi:hypothetical protein FRX31_015603 [Thalictrum thalictroides]|uniref:Uncharacterized protein n=1 Tax=Thalictrum thalictroides TaxID=46969 RepID=A0A7J6WDX6_THATH|nr:hypothetical protein FRX31_015603 [Thalictrum thalictroides]
MVRLDNKCITLTSNNENGWYRKKEEVVRMMGLNYVLGQPSQAFIGNLNTFFLIRAEDEVLTVNCEVDAIHLDVSWSNNVMPSS